MGNCEEEAGLKGQEAERAYSQLTASTKSSSNSALSEWKVPVSETRPVSAYSALSSFLDIICTAIGGSMSFCFTSPSVRRSRRDWDKNESIIQDLAMSEKDSTKERYDLSLHRRQINPMLRANLARISAVSISCEYPSIPKSTQPGRPAVLVSLKPASRYENQSMFSWVYQCFPSIFPGAVY